MRQHHTACSCFHKAACTPVRTGAEASGTTKFAQEAETLHSMLDGSLKLIHLWAGRFQGWWPRASRWGGTSTVHQAHVCITYLDACMHVCVCVRTGAKASGHSELAEEASTFSSPAPLLPWLWLAAHCQAQHEQPRSWLVLLR